MPILRPLSSALILATGQSKTSVLFYKKCIKDEDETARMMKTTGFEL